VDGTKTTKRKRHHLAQIQDAAEDVKETYKKGRIGKRDSKYLQKGRDSLSVKSVSSPTTTNMKEKEIDP
jgi:hypothetical protein